MPRSPSRCTGAGRDLRPARGRDAPGHGHQHDGVRRVLGPTGSRSARPASRSTASATTAPVPDPARGRPLVRRRPPCRVPTTATSSSRSSAGRRRVLGAALQRQPASARSIPRSTSRSAASASTPSSRSPTAPSWPPARRSTAPWQPIARWWSPRSRRTARWPSSAPAASPASRSAAATTPARRSHSSPTTR